MINDEIARLDTENQRRLWSKVRMAGEFDCWEWMGTRNNQIGHGMVCLTPKRLKLVHREVYERFCGDIPVGYCVLHRCDNPPCCNPNHLFLGTQVDNMADMASKGRKAGMPNAPGWKTVTRHPRAYVQLTIEQELEIVADSRTGPELAEVYGVHRSTIDRARIRHNAKRKAS